MNKKKTLNLFDDLDKRTGKMSSFLMSLDKETLNTPPTADAWSVTRVIQHLLQSELASHQYLQKKLGYNNELPPLGISDHIRLLLLGISLRLPLKYKAPGIVNEDMEERGDPHQLLEEWRQNRMKLREYLSQISEEVYTRSVFRHPVAGRIPLAGMIKFFGWHQARHFDQIRRTLKKLPRRR